MEDKMLFRIIKLFAYRFIFKIFLVTLRVIKIIIS